MLCLTERAVEHLVPVLGHRMKFLKALDKLRKEDNTCSGDDHDMPSPTCSSTVASELEVV